MLVGYFIAVIVVYFSAALSLAETPFFSTVCVCVLSTTTIKYILNLEPHRVFGINVVTAFSKVCLFFVYSGIFS